MSVVIALAAGDVNAELVGLPQTDSDAFISGAFHKPDTSLVTDSS